MADKGFVWASVCINALYLTETHHLTSWKHETEAHRGKLYPRRLFTPQKVQLLTYFISQIFLPASPEDSKSDPRP